MKKQTSPKTAKETSLEAPKLVSPSGKLIEIWKPILGYEGLYEISSFGRVKSLPRNSTIKKERFLKQHDAGHGYLVVNLSKRINQRTIRVHRLVAEHFIKKIQGKPEINHIDGLKINNNKNNLEWVTNKENNLHYLNMRRFTK
jgi:hypothetical protein